MKKAEGLKLKIHKTKSAITVISGYLQMLDVNIVNKDDPGFVKKNQQLVKKANTACNSLFKQIQRIEKELD
jgi:hypothetical protein